MKDQILLDKIRLDQLIKKSCLPETKTQVIDLTIDMNVIKQDLKELKGERYFLNLNENKSNVRTLAIAGYKMATEILVIDNSLKVVSLCLLSVN